VAPDGRALTVDYTIAVLDPATGEWSGEIGPGRAAGTRMVVEAPGTPVASFEEAFGTPGATPAD
jgi:hypothetical protein